MAAITHHGGDHHNEAVHHQYEDIEQQNESYIVGMWTFLVTEVMFFGALFFTYSLYRFAYQLDFWKAHTHLDVFWGGFNTVVLLLSSFTMVLAVFGAQTHNRKMVLFNITLTIAAAFIFLVVKFFEYSSKIEHHLVPGIGFTTDPQVLHGANLNHAQLFYGLYFGMTGLHGVHVVVGILVLGALFGFWYKKNRLVTKDFIPTELVGLYWHFVDLVWIFLFPLFYLMPAPMHGLTH